MTSLCDNKTGQSLLDRSGLGRSSGDRDWSSLNNSACMVQSLHEVKKKGELGGAPTPLFND
ncbi:hypothetical protein RRU01S_16_01040 [Agrobacterium rubi TR3 = NBRC 13261]|uniref:Uncharacterized protein n=1 Tax=Agrobacterium rubi TR3 = NBRC 13261 TaxID=1368415 RepID=A0A081CXE5_9HYPH|nr:hypothetical protein RRU01S_16_01040 [Agrobacterium rubi TR3 = NBRC 13261]